jgi:hypothetical protein
LLHGFHFCILFFLVGVHFGQQAFHVPLHFRGMTL